jgi:hypothetical protein
MNNVDEMDRTWRDGLAAAASTAAVDAAPLTDPRARVAARVRRLRRTRAVVVTSTAILATTAVAVGVGVLVHRSPRTNITHTPEPTVAPASTVLEVTDAPGGRLLIVFPNHPETRTLGQIDLPAGDIKLIINMATAGHHLVIDGVSDFAADDSGGPATITTNVRLVPGRYLLHCIIPGHTAAGETATLNVH